MMMEACESANFFLRAPFLHGLYKVTKCSFVADQQSIGHKTVLQDAFSFLNYIVKTF